MPCSCLGVVVQVLTQIASADSRTSVYERATSQAEAERQVLRATKRWLDTVTSGEGDEEPGHDGCSAARTRVRVPRQLCGVY